MHVNPAIFTPKGNQESIGRNGRILVSFRQSKDSWQPFQEEKFHAVFNWEFKDVRPRGVTETRELIQISMLVTQRGLEDSGFLFNRELERNINSDHRVGRITKRAVLQSPARAREGGKKEI